MENTKKKNNKKIVVGLFILFLVLLGTTLFVSFSTLLQEDEIVIKSMTPVYDETSGVVVDQSNVKFNDKNQVVKYNVVLENTQDYDIKISDIKLSTPTEEFLDYKVEGVEVDDVLEANSTKELTVSFETMGIKGWGRNFADELTANISFEKVSKQEEVTPPVEDDKEEEKQPEAPATNIEEIVKESEKIEVESITNNTIEFKDGFKVEDASKVETWIYPETEFYGYKEVDESKIIKEIVLEKERLDELEITPGEHKIVISTEEEILGYIDIYINEDKEISKEKPQDSTDKEDLPVTKPSTDNKEDEKVENPYTNNNGLVVVFGVATFITGIAIIFLCNKKVAKYTVFILMLSPSFTITNAEKVIEVAIKNNVSFESQNVMKPARQQTEYGIGEYTDYWGFKYVIQNFYIQNEITEITDYTYKFDVTEEQNGRIIAYLIKNGVIEVQEKDSLNMIDSYDLYLQADGIIYPNTNASYYFANMEYLNKIDNIEGLDTSNVTDMSNMFFRTGFFGRDFTLDVSSFDTSKVKNMSGMFSDVGYGNPNFTLDISNFDTSNVTDMSSMFECTSLISLDLSNFDTSNVISMSGMFRDSSLTDLDLSSFDTSNVTDMSVMFLNTSLTSLDLSSFDTSNVISMSGMFQNTSLTSLDLSNFDTSNVTDMSVMFSGTGYGNPNFTLDISNFDTSNVISMGGMFSDSSLTTLDLSNFDTSNVMYMSGMFRDSSLTTLDLSNFDTSNVVSMNGMFQNTSLTSLDLSNFDTSEVKEMQYMFANTSLTSLDLSNFDTSEVKEMQYMFANTSLTSLDLSNFDTSKVTSMSGMFQNTSLTSLDLSSFDTSNVTMMMDMFNGSNKLSSFITIKGGYIFYSSIFENAATSEGAKIIVNYTSKSESLVDEMLKTANGNVIKGELVD